MAHTYLLPKTKETTQKTMDPLYAFLRHIHIILILKKIIIKFLECKGGARGVMVIVVGNGHGDTSSNPGRDWLHFT